MKEVQPTFSFDEEGMKKFKAYTLTRVLELKNDIIRAINYRNCTINGAEGADRTLMNSLKRLQNTVVSYDTLEVTGIGRTLNELRNHPSEKIRKLSRSMITEWKQMVEKCIKYDKAAAAAAAGAGITAGDIGNITTGRGSKNRSRQASLKAKLVLKKKQQQQPSQQQQVVEVLHSRGG